MCLRLILRISGVAFLRREIFTSDQFNSSFPLLCFCNKWKRAKRECWKKVWNWKWRFPSRFQSESERRWGDRRRPNKNPTDSSDRKMPLSKLLGVRMRRTMMVAVIILMRKLSLGINILFSIFIYWIQPHVHAGIAHINQCWTLDFFYDLFISSK